MLQLHHTERQQRNDWVVLQNRFDRNAAYTSTGYDPCGLTTSTYRDTLGMVAHEQAVDTRLFSLLPRGLSSACVAVSLVPKPF